MPGAHLQWHDVPWPAMASLDGLTLAALREAFLGRMLFEDRVSLGLS